MENYDRAVCTFELRLRDCISKRINHVNWEPTRSFEGPSLPSTGAEGIKAVTSPPPVENEGVKDEWDISTELDQMKKTTNLRLRLHGVELAS